MTRPPPKTCATCGRAIAAREVYYRFKLVLQGEQDVLDAGGGGGEDDLAALVRQLEAGPEDPRELEEQVHWERIGVVCAACRSMAVRLLPSPPPLPEPH
ncbi:MAG TPA: hypothetical protein VE153_10050 [Myxococcus sp.]|nr:hypothetical protein [Myxococcus sp.]